MKRFLIILTIAIPLLGAAQSNFQKGYVVTNSKDTLKGFIDYKEQRNNPTSFVFKSAMNDKEQTFEIKDCAAYGMTDLDAFERFVVNISKSQIAASQLSIGLDTSFKREAVFLKVLQKGQFVNLYSYTDVIKERYYIKEAEVKEPVELVNSTYISDDWKKTIVTSNKYVRQLYAIMVKVKKGEEINEAKLLGLDYSARDMIKTVSDMNGVKKVKSTYRSSRFFAGLDLVATNAKYLKEDGIPFDGQSYSASRSMESKQVYSPMLSVGLDWFLNPRIGKLIFRAELALTMSKHEITGTAELESIGRVTHSFGQLNLAVAPQFIYNVYNTNRIKFFFGAGVALNLSNYDNNKIIRVYNFDHAVQILDDYQKLEKVYFSLQGKVGVVFNKKIEVLIGYTPYAPITSYGASKVGIQRTAIGVNYLFGKH